MHQNHVQQSDTTNLINEKIEMPYQASTPVELIMQDITSGWFFFHDKLASCN